MTIDLRKKWMPGAYVSDHDAQDLRHASYQTNRVFEVSHKSGSFYVGIFNGVHNIAAVTTARVILKMMKGKDESTANH